MYHNVNCTKCGEKVSADAMALDVDYLLNFYAEKMLDRNPKNAVYIMMHQALSNISLRLYFAYDYLVESNRLDEGNKLVLDGEEVLRLVQKKHGIDLTDEDGEYAASENALEAMTEKMGTREDVWVKWEDKKRKIKELMDLLLGNRDTVFLECRVEARKEADDMGNIIVTCVRCRIGGEQSDVINLVCPVCGEPFLLEAGKYREEVILLMGSARVGKTAYLAALIDFLSRENAKKKLFPFELGALEDKKGIFFRESILKKYRSGDPVLKTIDSNEEMVPLVSILLEICGKKEIVTFIDMPGEAFVPMEEGAFNKKFDYISNRRRVSRNASAYIFCIAPEQIDMFIKEKEKGSSDSAMDDMDLILASISHAVKLVNMKSAETPTAVVFTKCDKIKDYNFYNPNERFEDLILDNRFFLVDKYHLVTKEIREYLGAAHVQPVEGKLRSIFSKFNYFTAASYGPSINNPADEGNKARPQPSGIILPFLWLMTMLGYFRPVRIEYERKKVRFWGRKYEDNEKIIPLEIEELVQK